MRLDQHLAKQAGSRAKAQDWIAQGRVAVNGKIIKKCSFAVSDADEISVEEKEEYVSRAGFKLENALKAFSVDLGGQTVLDIGASTGGFTDVCLRHGAALVYALDVGHLQLSPVLEQDKRVVKMEGINARNLKKEWFDVQPDFVCMDVSFISCRTILDALFAQFVPEHLAVLVKPQFECGPQALNGSGVLKNDKLRQRIIEEVKAYLQQYYKRVQITEDIPAGRSGNREALAYAAERRTL